MIKRDNKKIIFLIYNVYFIELMKKIMKIKNKYLNVFNKLLYKIYYDKCQIKKSLRLEIFVVWQSII